MPDRRSPALGIPIPIVGNADLSQQVITMEDRVGELSGKVGRISVFMTQAKTVIAIVAVALSVLGFAFERTCQQHDDDLENRGELKSTLQRIEGEQIEIGRRLDRIEALYFGREPGGKP